MTRSAVALGVGALLLVLAAVSWRQDPRRWRTGVLVALAAWIGLGLALDLLDALLDSVDWGDFVVLALPFAIALLVAVVLVLNGLQMARREGRTIGNLLSFLLGVAIAASTLLGVALFWSGSGFGTGQTWLLVLGLVVLLLPGYPALALLSYLIYCVAYSRHRAPNHPAAIVVLGSGLVRGEVPRLLANRLDTAVAQLRAEQRLGRHPVVVPSGGQGPDEPTSEGAAMTAYLLERGVLPGDVLTEDRATTTEENLALSLALLRDRGVEGPVRVVTSNYHVGRAALIARRLRIDADVVGAPTAWYFVPSAFLREFVAAVTYRPVVNAVGLLLWAGVTAFLTYAVVVG